MYPESISADSSTDAWVVGSGNDQEATVAAIRHWDGTSWRYVRGLQPVGDDNQLFSVVALAPTDVWAVGLYDGAGGYQSWSEHRDGSTWTIVTPADDLDVSLCGIDAASATDVWAVGATASTAAIENWDGTQWNLVPSPEVANGVLWSVSAASASDVWAVGNDGQGLCLTEHWDGVSWQRVTCPNDGVKVQLRSVAAVAVDEAFAVGSRQTAGGSMFTELMVWDGTAWQQAKHRDPGLGSRYRGLTGVDASSRQDAWAVGQYDSQDGQLRNETIHFDGTGWDLVPSRGDRGSDLHSVADVSPSKAFAVGYNTDEGG